MRCKADPGHGGNEPFGRVVLIPFDSVTVVHWELMVEVVVSFTDRHKSGENVITGSVLVIEGGFSKPVSKGIDAKG